MSSESDSRSWFVRFCDTFLQEQNIKYMLGVGMLILLGSSLMLVTTHWDSYSPEWKYLVLIAYTATIHVGGQITYHSLSLRKTGTGLMSLTALLLPISFLAVRWIEPDEPFALAVDLDHAALAALLGVNVVFTALAARRIFRHFLRRTQPTFLISYLLLCLAGAVVPLLPEQFAPWTTLALWCVFAAGSIKVNRHVFWLTEEHRLPRICGFFPILLLGGMFLTLFAVSLAPHVPLTWIGLGCVLAAIPVLLSADAVADVFQKRGDPGARLLESPASDASQSRDKQAEACTPTTGGLPWSIALPLWIGLALTVVGVCLSGTGFPDTFALAPTALLAGVMMALTARRTGRPGFVWAMLLGFLIAYQVSPTFFQEFARQVVHQAADAVNETRLPIAFYGLTYLPLLVATSMAAVFRRRSGDDLFAMPLQRFSIGLSLLLLACSLTHVKAVFPSGVALAVAFLAQTRLFRDRRLLIPTVVAWATATLGSVPFAEQVLEQSVTSEGRLLIWTGSAALLFVLGGWLDPLTRRFKADDTDWIGTAPFTQIAGFGLLLTPTSAWLVQSLFAPGTPTGWISAIALSVMLLVNAFRWRRTGVTDLSLAFPVAAAALISVSHGASVEQIVTLLTALLSVLWLSGSFRPSIHSSGWHAQTNGMGVDVDAHHALRASGRATLAGPMPTVRAAFTAAARRVSTTGLVLLLISYLLPVCGLWILAAGTDSWSWNQGDLAAWVPMALIVLWTFDAARRQWPGWIVLAWLAGIGFSGALAVEQGVSSSWLPAIWAGLTLPAILSARRLRQSKAENLPVDLPESAARSEQVSRLLTYCTFFTLTLIALLSLLLFSTAFRVAGGISLCGLLWLATLRRQRLLRTLALMLVNWQVLCGIVQFVSPDIGSLFQIGWDQLVICALPVAAAAALQALVWEIVNWPAEIGSLPDEGKQGASGILPDLIRFHSVVLQLIAGFAVVLTLPAFEDGLALTQIAWAVLAFATLSALRVADALRTVATCEKLRLTVPVDSTEFRRLREFAEAHVWCAIGIIGAATGYFWMFNVVTLGSGACLFVLLGCGVASALAANWALQSPRTAILGGPLRTTALWLPGITVLAGIVRHFHYADPEWEGLNSLALLLAAGFYFWRGIEQHKKRLIVLSAGIVNIALALLWHELELTDPQFFMIPLGATLLVLVELLKPELPKATHDPLRYIAALTILVSPTFHIVGGSWLHLASLMVASVAVTLVAMGLRVRALMYMGTGFLVADMIAMVVRGSVDHPSLLWIAGILIGAAVIALAAWCERNREQILQRLRILSAELQTWE